jgi:hypothetical protein
LVLILDCPTCAQLPQKSRSDRLPDGAEALIDAPAETRRCPQCSACYYYNYDFDPGEPMVPSTETYTLMRLTPVLARAQLQGAPDHATTEAQAWLDLIARDWDIVHAAFAAAAVRPPASPHLVKHIVESLTDYYLENDDKAAFSRTLLSSPRAAVRANAAADFLYVATEEHPVWNVRAFSRHQQRLAAPWLDDADFTRAILDALVGCLDAEGETLSLDATFGYRAQRACETAYFGLANAFYRKLDPASIMPALRKLAGGPDGHGRELAARLLDEL